MKSKKICMYAFTLQSGRRVPCLETATINKKVGSTTYCWCEKHQDK